jgi:hypothetical protein
MFLEALAKGDENVLYLICIHFLWNLHARLMERSCTAVLRKKNMSFWLMMKKI